MLHKVKDLRGGKIAATDGEIGQVDQVYFDDQDWRVRYFVVDTGGWLSGRKVLISPLSIDRARSHDKSIAVSLSREQVERSPSIDADKPVGRQYEEAYARYYGYSLYWAPPEAGHLSAVERRGRRAKQVEDAERKASQSHLRSSRDVTGYSVQAADGAIGRLDDILVDDRDWTIADLVVDTRDRKVVIPAEAVDDIDWESREVRVHLRREDVERAPGSA